MHHQDFEVDISLAVDVSREAYVFKRLLSKSLDGCWRGGEEVVGGYVNSQEDCRCQGGCGYETYGHSRHHEEDDEGMLLKERVVVVTLE